MEHIEVYLPECSEDEVSEGLRILTEHCCKVAGVDISAGFLGGEYGYGAYYENNTFMMHPYCWCDSDTCPWCGEENRANFIFKPTGATVHWYKYIGRGMEIYGDLPLHWLQECRNSVDALASHGEGRDSE